MGGVCSSYGGWERRIQSFGGGNLREIANLGDPDGEARIILRRIFKKWCVWVWTGSSWHRIGEGEGACECGYEPSGSIKCEEFLD